MLNSTESRRYRAPSQLGGNLGHDIGGEEYYDPIQTSPKSAKAAPRKSLKTRLAGAFVSRDNLADYAYADDTGEKPARKRSVLKKGGPPSAYRQPDSSPDRPIGGAGKIYAANIDQEPQLPRIPTSSFSEGGFDYNNNDDDSGQQQGESDRLGPDAWVQSTTTTTTNRLSQQQQQMQQTRPTPRQQNSYTLASVPVSHEQPAQQFTSLTGNRPASRLGLSDERPASPGRLAQAPYPTQLASSPSRQRKDPLGSPMGMRQPGQVQATRPSSTASLLAQQPQSSPVIERIPQQNTAIATPPLRTQLARGSVSNISTPATPSDDPRELESLSKLETYFSVFSQTNNLFQSKST